MQKWIFRRDDAEVGSVERRDECHRVGEAGVIRDEQDRTVPWDAIETGDLDAR